jgi:uncharacterized membrane protein
VAYLNTYPNHRFSTSDMTEERNLLWWSLRVQSVFYVLSGVNHFVNPDFYLSMIPPYLPSHPVLNLLAGVVEITFGALLLNRRMRVWAALGIMAMLTAFVPVHVYFIEIGGCIEGGLCVPPWLAWVRLLVVHPMLMFWAWRHRMS